ncbi:MAG: glycosyltransferase family 2 protein [Paludibacteraceae bacterium]|nr:glycosyltransferase family 2 protein [Paludibacteraceae bacterium]
MTNANKYTVTIIIPTLNEELFIEKCILSVLSQSFDTERMDVIIADGGSTDKTVEIVQNIAKEHTNVRLINNPKRFQSAAFNLGVSVSDSPFVIRMDAHATYDSHYVERCVNLLENHPEYGNVGGICEILPQNNSLIARANALLNHLKFGIGGADFRIGTKAQETDSVPFGAFRRIVIDRVGGMREDLRRGEDNEYNSRIRKAGYTVWFDPSIRSAYYARPSLSSSCKQMYANGISIGQLFYVDRKAIGLRHLVPLAFVLAIIGCALLACFTIYGLYLLCALLLTYALAALFADIDACRKNGWEFIFILPILFFCVHVSYGIGTIFGLFSRPRRTLTIG